MTDERRKQIADEINKILSKVSDDKKKSNPAAALMIMINFTLGAMWADAHPHWISVEDELPKISWTMSDTVVVTDGNGGLRLAWYHQDEGWHFATGLPFEPTHWMPLPQPPKGE